MPTTLADIARELGVSKMTVSRAINNHPEVNAETRERVLAVARRMKYQPNQHARALITNRSHLLGMVAPDLMHSYFAEILRGIESVARPAKLRILVCNTYEDADNEIAGMIATEHLISLGHRRIGHLRGASASVAGMRLEGYRQALAKHKLRFDKSLVRECGFIEDQGYDAMRAWIAEGDLPEAVFAVNDPVAIGAMHALTEAGYRVGSDIAVVGAGNIHYGDMLSVPLTTVAWPTAEIGQQAARLLIEMIKGDASSRSPQSIVVPPYLIARHSSGADNLKTTTARARTSK